MGRLDGKVALITGAGRGMGASHARVFAHEGADIVLLDAPGSIRPGTRCPRARTSSGRSPRSSGTTGGPSPEGDVRAGRHDGAGRRRARELGRIDFLVANAGIAARRDDQMTEEAWQETVDINLTGVWRSVKSAGRAHDRARRGGSVVLISSVAGDLGLMNMTHYVSAKHGVVGLAKALANELGGHGIRVNAVLPGTVNTDMAINDATFKLFRPDLESPGLADVEDVMRGLTLLPTRWVEPEDVSNAVLWLSSDEARFVTGVALPVDAGYMVKSS